jgi:type I restriction enzyme S subunit
MSSELTKASFSELVEVTDYVANGSFASLKENVTYLDQDGYAVLVRLVDHNAGWKGEHVYVGKSAYEFLRKSSLLAGDVVVANVGANAGSVFRVPKLSRPATLGPNAVRVRPKHEASLTKDFLYYYLASPVGQEKLQSIITGSAQPKFNKTALRGLNIEIPDVGVQKKVASFMMSVDDRITLLSETNTTLEAIAQALFKSWFVDFDPVHAKMQGRAPEGMDEATAALFPDGFEESELGDVPKGWHVKSLDAVASFLNGLALQKFPPTGDNDLPVIKIAQLRKGDTVGADLASRSIKPEYVIQNGDVLFSWSGSLEVEIWCGGEGALNQHLFKVTSDVFPKWFYFLWTRHHLEHFRQVAASKATTMGHIQRAHLTGAKVLVPGAEVLYAANSVLEPILNRLIENSLQAFNLAALRDNLLPRLISGQIQLPEVGQLEESLA